MRKKYIIATIKNWNLDNYKKFCKKNNFYLIKKKQGLAYKKIKRLNPQYIFFPHWSWIIPEEIWSNFKCVVFHMTDLPYGRGGTPLQNLILRGHKKTKISAIKVTAGLDAGDIYCKENLSLEGRAEEIYKRCSKIIFKKMIPYIIKNNPAPKKQKGRVVIFKRRKSEQSELPECKDIKKLYDFIRMLDAQDYPRAFIKCKGFVFEFSEPKLHSNEIISKVKIKKLTKKQNESKNSCCRCPS